MECKTVYDIFKLVFKSLYAAGVTAASFWYFFKITFGTVPEDNMSSVNLILGFLIGAGLSTFYGYYFGTSQQQNKPIDEKEIKP